MRFCHPFFSFRDITGLSNSVDYEICHKKVVIDPFRTGNPETGALENNEDLDEMPHCAAFHQGLHCLLRLKQSSEKRNTLWFENYNQ